MVSRSRVAGGNLRELCIPKGAGPGPPTWAPARPQLGLIIFRSALATHTGSVPRHALAMPESGSPASGDPWDVHRKFCLCFAFALTRLFQVLERKAVPGFLKNFNPHICGPCFPKGKLVPISVEGSIRHQVALVLNKCTGNSLTYHICSSLIANVQEAG